MIHNGMSSPLALRSHGWGGIMGGLQGENPDESKTVCQRSVGK